jgi:hypothetical protein
MKSILKATTITLSMSAALFTASCGNETKHDESAEHKHGGESHSHSGAHTYICPMNCENGKTYTEPGKCPKCGMELEHNDDAGKDKEFTYFMEFKSNPAELEAGKEGLLSFTPKIKGKEAEAVPLDEVHEKKLHLIIASSDLAYFEHIHPEYQADGSYQIKVLGKGQEYTIGRGHNETRFEEGGSYMLFADYAPTGGMHQMEKIPLTVKGAAYKETTFSKEKLIATVDGYTVSLEAEGGKWTINEPMHIKAVVKKGNKVLDANTFENYLGAKSHMVVLKTGSYDYLHVHPEVENGNLDLHTTFETPGIYRGWLQFQTEGKVHTADFVIKVEQGAKKTSESHSDHKH